MDQVLQTVTGSEMLSMLDGFLGYNQIEVSEPDQHKTAFTTPWGTFAYRRMPFGLINAGATFQRAMDLAFCGIVGRFIPDFAEKTRHIVNMMKGKSSFHWNSEGRAAFNEIKDAIAHAPMLEFGTKRGNWIAKIQEYDLEIKPTKLVQGRGLCQLMAENIPEERELDDSEDLPKVLFVSTIDECLYKKAIDGTFLRCVDKAQQTKLLESFHDKAYGGHFSTPVTTHKILREKYYWPTLFQDAFWWVRKCVHCQQFVGKPKLAALPLKPVIVEEPFRKWGIDFIGVINPSSSAGHSYVLIAIDYFTKWVEAIPVKNATSEVESSNMNLITIIRKLVEENQRSWHKALFDALWANMITPKRAIVRLLHTRFHLPQKTEGRKLVSFQLLVWSGWTRRMKNMHQRLDTVFGKIIDEHVKRKARRDAEEEEEEQQKDLVDVLVGTEITLED
ncbi:uncharacterized protein LOC131054285 [Cryptomeria japonica]|uniref:uncharacterized protein LOC131054285 n=1 Tax=Cryptomeria japonica TaxID=3369 RepID=UPI0027DA30CD|nr:uncharacterized protein LOC131054285 [Cryptomeria japonica]